MADGREERRKGTNKSDSNQTCECGPFPGPRKEYARLARCQAPHLHPLHQWVLPASRCEGYSDGLSVIWKTERLGSLPTITQHLSGREEIRRPSWLQLEPHELSHRQPRPPLPCPQKPQPHLLKGNSSGFPWPPTSLQICFLWHVRHFNKI